MSAQKTSSAFFVSLKWHIPKHLIVITIFLITVLCSIKPCHSGWPYFTNTQYIEDSWTKGGRRFDFKDGNIYVSNRQYGRYQFVKGDVIEFWIGQKHKGLFLLEKKDRDTMLWWKGNVNGEKLSGSAAFEWSRFDEKEWLKAEERRAEAEKKRLEMEEFKRKTIEWIEWSEKYGPYRPLANDIVEDPEANLEWIAGPDRGTSFEEARLWTRNLTLAGGGWRMPETNELQNLYNRSPQIKVKPPEIDAEAFLASTFDKGYGNRKLTPFLKTTGRYVWSSDLGERNGMKYAKFFDFRLGTIDWELCSSSRELRVFAVRSKSQK